MTPIDPLKSAKKAVLGNRRTVEAYGRLVVECGLFNLPTDVLVGALLDVARTVNQLDKERMEVWREAGQTFLAEIEGELGARTRRAPRKRAEDAGQSKAANEG